MKLKKIAAVALAGMMALSVAACGGGDTKSDTQSGGNAEAKDPTTVSGIVTPNQDAANTKTTDETLNVGLSSEPSMLWSGGCGKAENEECMITNALFDRLVNLDMNEKTVEANLATNWEWVDATHCKFTLRDDVTMSDGTPFVADDVVYSVNTWMEKSASSETGQYLKGAEKNDDHSVTIEYNCEAPDLVGMMTWTNFGIVSEDEVNALGGIDAALTNPKMGCGKYTFKEWKNGQYITIERNDNYWNKDYKGYYKEIKFTFTADAAAREMAIESGDLDVAVDMPVSQAATYATSDKVQTVIDVTDETSHLWYNMGANAGATKDLKVRQAIDKALDINAITQVGSAGFSKAATAYMSETSPYYTQSVTAEQSAADVEGAKALLKEAGYENGLELRILGLAMDNAIYTVVQANLQQVGITLTIDTPDTPQFVQGAFGGDYDIIIVGDPLTQRLPNAFLFTTKLNVEGPGMCIGGPKWTTDEVDSKIAQFIAEKDNAKAKEIAAEIDQLYVDNMICSNLYAIPKAYVIAKDLKGMGTVARNYIDVTTFYK